MIEDVNRIVNIMAERCQSVSNYGIVRILVGGKGSYIGSKVRDYLNLFPERYQVTELDLLNKKWKEHDFSQYDIVYQVAGIAHQKETLENAHLYYKVNCDLAYEVAVRAKKAGVKKYIYMSSMSVYGLDETENLITVNTKEEPVTNYGKSKLQAERKLAQLTDNNFSIAYLRPPMVYGEGAPGNLGRLLQAVEKVHLFPTLRNKRSSISVENLCKGVKMVIDSGFEGIVILQDADYHCTVDIVKENTRKDGVLVIYTGVFNPLIKLMIGRNSTISKVFGNLRYSMEKSV